MKKVISKRLSLVIAVTMLLVLLLNLFLQISSTQKSMEKSALQMIRRITSVLERDNTDVSRIFSQLAVEDGVTWFAVDTASGLVVGSTESAYVGRIAKDIGLNIIVNYEASYAVRLNGVFSRCIFREYDDMMIGIVYVTDTMYRDLVDSMLMVLFYIVLASAIMIVAILSSIDHLVISNIRHVNSRLQDITNGNLDTRVEAGDLPEFVSLSTHINQMTDSLLSTSVKISRILDAADAQIGFFEYSDESQYVLVTQKVAAILAISPDEMSILCENRDMFSSRIDSIRKSPVERSKHVYALPTETECYVKLETFEDERGTFGIVMDVTEETIEKVRLRHERDHDVLTQLSGRRAFYRSVGELFAEPERIGQAAMLMFDLDGLKTINDTCGHAGGDKAIREAANVLAGIGLSTKLVARLSGDEFAVFLYGAESREELQQHIDTLYCNMLEAEVRVFDQVIPVRLSGGYVFYPEYRVSYTELLRMADRALYHSKGNGKARFSVYSEELEHIQK